MLPEAGSMLSLLKTPPAPAAPPAFWSSSPVGVPFSCRLAYWLGVWSSTMANGRLAFSAFAVTEIRCEAAKPWTGATT